MTSKTVVIMLESARATRARAQRARVLMETMESPDVVESLIRHAEELEASARELEQRALTMAETIARTQALSAEIKVLIQEARLKLGLGKAASRRSKPN